MQNIKNKPKSVQTQIIGHGIQADSTLSLQRMVRLKKHFYPFLYAGVSTCRGAYKFFLCDFFWGLRKFAALPKNRDEFSVNLFFTHELSCLLRISWMIKCCSWNTACCTQVRILLSGLFGKLKKRSVCSQNRLPHSGWIIIRHGSYGHVNRYSHVIRSQYGTINVHIST